MIYLVHPNDAFRSAQDVFGIEHARTLRSRGVRCESVNAGGATGSTLGRFRKLRGVWRAASLVSRFHIQRTLLTKLRSGDVVVVLSDLARGDTKATLERMILTKGAKYIFYLIDNWFEVPDLRVSAHVRCSMADKIIVVSPQLHDAVKQRFPRKRVEIVEEPLDLKRFQCKLPAAHDASQHFAAWTGNPFNLRQLSMVGGAMREVQMRTGLKLRVICDEKPRPGALECEFEHIGFDHHSEAAVLHGALCGLAPLEDNDYTRCKSTFKIKVYAAAGIPCVASAVGYNKSLVTDGVTGWCVENHQQWVMRILHLSEDKTARAAMSKQALELARDRFSFEATVDRFLEALHS